MQTRQAEVYALLDALAIKYRKLAHLPAYTMEDLAAPERELGARFCKNLFLANRQQSEFFLLLIRGDKRFRTSEVSKKLGRSRLSFGNDERLLQLLGVSPGAVSPLGLMFDTGRQVNLVIDRGLLTEENICLHPCVNTESLVMKTRDLTDIFIPRCGHLPELIDID